MFEDPSELPLFTVRVYVAGLPPFASNVTVTVVPDVPDVHLAYTAIFEFTIVVAVNWVPPPFNKVHQPPKV